MRHSPRSRSALIRAELDHRPRAEGAARANRLRRFAGGTAALRVPLALEVPGVSFALLASATAAEIIFDILFWVVVAAYLDGFEFKRATPLVYMALRSAARRGVVARAGAGALAPADLLLLLPPMAALVVVQLAVVASRLREVPEAHPDSVDDEDATLGPIALGRLLRRYPLALLIALNALVVTPLRDLFHPVDLRGALRERSRACGVPVAAVRVHADRRVRASYSLTRLLLERTGPLLRNLVFPLLSLGGLIFLVLSPRLLAAVVVHVNIEAVSNGLPPDRHQPRPSIGNPRAAHPLRGHLLPDRSRACRRSSGAPTPKRACSRWSSRPWSSPACSSSSAPESVSSSCRRCTRTSDRP